MLKIECIKDDINGRENYSGYIKYGDLVKFGFLKELTVNRITDQNRLPGMEKYIKKPSSIYPPIVVALEKGTNVSYNNTSKELMIDNGISENNEKLLVIIDGQHRFLSIKQAIRNSDDEAFRNRKQPIFILTEMSDIEQRNLFIEINDHMKRVSSASKDIFDISIPNYLSLKIIKDFGIANKINMKNDQYEEKYPYKFILSGNRVLFKSLKVDSFDEKDLLDILNKYSNIAKKIWTDIFIYLEKNSSLKLGVSDNCDKENQYDLITTEAFIKSLCKIIKEDSNLYTLISNYDSNIDDIKTEFDKILNKIYEINFNSYLEDFKNINKLERERRLYKIMSGEIGSNE